MSEKIKKPLFFITRWILVFLVISVLAFLCPRLLPETPVEHMLESYQLEPTQENIDIVTKAWGLDRPLPVQYGVWMINFMRGDWGHSLTNGADIRDQFARRMPYTLILGIGGLLLSSLAAFFVGFRAAMKENGFWDITTRFLSIMSITIPAFISCIVIVYFLGVKLKWIRFFTGNPAYCLVIAVFLMVLYQMGPISRVVKEHFRTQMSQSHVTFAVSRGFPLEYVLLRQCYKPVLIGLISITMSSIPSALGGGSLMEYAFGIPGISSLLISSLSSSDYNVLQVYLMIIVFVVFITHVLLDVVLSVLERGLQT